MQKTIKWVLLSLNLCEYTHVVVRRRAKDRTPIYLGGGSVADVLQRFGDLTIMDSMIAENILVIYAE